MNLRGVLGVTALVAVFLIAGLGLSLVGAMWKGTLPGEESGVSAATAIVPSGPIPTAQIGGANTGAAPTRGQGQSTPGATASGAQRPAVEPAVLELVVCDVTVDCGESPNRTEWDAVTTCVRIRSGSDNRPLVLVVTAAQTPPAGPSHSSVIARSETIRASGTLACHPVRAVRGSLPRGEYSMWVLDDSAPVAQVRFRLGRS